MKTINSVARLLGLLSIPALLSGCASVTCGSRQEVSLYSKPNAAEVFVYNNHGEVVYHGATPCAPKLERTAPESGRANYTVLFKKKGFEPVQIQLKSVMNRAGVANVFGAGAGLLVDSNTGGMWTLQAVGNNPGLVPSPDMLHPDGVCAGLKVENEATVTAKVTPFGQ